MACDAARMTLHAAEQAITHTDNDQRMGVSFTARCDTATVYLGGAGVTNATGYDVPAGTEFGLDDNSDVMHVCVASADEGAILKVLWSGV